MQMPKGGVSELLKSESGRKYLSEIQRAYHKELLQPTNRDGSRNAEFYRVYGKDVDKRAKQYKEQVSKAKDEWKSESRVKPLFK